MEKEQERTSYPVAFVEQLMWYRNICRKIIVRRSMDRSYPLISFSGGGGGSQAY